VVAGGAYDCLDGADDDVWLSVEALDEVVAAQGNDVQMVAGQRGEFVLHGCPQSVKCLRTAYPTAAAMITSATRRRRRD
jgi:hypothetical protein